MSDIAIAPAVGNDDGPATAADLERTMRGLAEFATETGEDASAEIKRIARIGCRTMPRDAARLARVGARALAKAAQLPPSPPPRPQVSRAPRAARARRTHAASPRVESGDGGDGPAPRPILCHQRTALALFGLSPRRFLELVARLQIPHRVDRRLTLCRVDDVLQALGLEPKQDEKTTAPDPDAWRAAALVAITGGRK